MPYGRHLIEDDDISAVVDVLSKGWLTQGPEVDDFEAALAKTVGARHVVSCSSGTAALHLAVKAAGIGPGDTVVVPANTFVATANAVGMCGAEVLFADVDPVTGLMTAASAESAITNARSVRPRALMPVYFAGQCNAPADLQALADQHDLVIIEDACHALGSRYLANGQTNIVGSCAHATLSTFSFHPVKTIAMGEGGAVTTNDDALATRLRDLRNHGLVRDPARFTQEELGTDGSNIPHPWYYEMHEPGFNYRASGLHCALGLSQLRKLDRFVEKRQMLAAHYDKRLAALAPSIQPLGRVENCWPAWHLYMVLIDFPALNMGRQELMGRLLDHNIGSQVHYIPVPWQPYYRDQQNRTEFPGAAKYYESCLSLPLFPAMERQDVDRVVEALETISNQAP